ncbi:MAG: arginine--tRNA ligase [Bacteroidetes bacterium GWF2_42_66]|nr:MAG: arginine--tRNA ligase [Bacteroidetes bacterium GWA2_42_15]OFY01155.1 MAG: arginine--tRNA ligase [Bacteroidetes bacterium GWE2_42_39]OFY41998.1 MAG: arginine--tRNA ligase [Bacteroidetes bacterium GWF2_42_66]HBL77803.1 arginine--tRNA ligase [Prolixibacteraceae bacterium]HCR90466.1 arginine--tRNA ligase [Prolixibacteraceae bacterium]
MTIDLIIRDKVLEAVEKLYEQKMPVESVQVQITRKEFEGDLTVIVFPFLRFSKKSPEQTAEDLGNYLLQNINEIDKFNVVKGFLNLGISSSYWLSVLNNAYANPDFGFKKASDESPLVMVEYSSPNTNKPLHLGHIRNNLLGYSLCEILKANGNRVVKTNIVNDRGIHICKSMLAWQQWGNGETPESSGMKGDHLVGKYYVLFDKEYKKEIAGLVASGMGNDDAEQNAPSIVAARELLRKWENKDPETIGLWKTMNGWVYKGFDVTYKKMGVDFDKIYYESETYIIGRDEVMRGLNEGIFYQKEDGSVWADLTADGLDHKILLRSDGTSVYMTQDIGTAKERFNDYTIDKMIYVVGNEQNYHFQVLSILLDKLGFEWGKGLHHFSYGMVELPNGKMKSREGTVVDADDLIEEMVHVARKTSEELGKLEGLPEHEAEETFRLIALGALKYFILKVDPKKNMLFNPEESIDFNGNTGPFIQYTYARIQSVLRKAAEQGIVLQPLDMNLDVAAKEQELIKKVVLFESVVEEAGNLYSPALIANYVYDLVKEFNQFYHDFSILKEENDQVRNLRLALAETIAKIIRSGMKLLGIGVVERM